MSTQPTVQAEVNNAQQSVRLGLFLEPLDVLFLRDGRPFGPTSRGQSLLLPLPQTVAGAIRTALLEYIGCPFSELTRLFRNHEVGSLKEALEKFGLPTLPAQLRFRGPFLAALEEDIHQQSSPVLRAENVFVTCPASLHADKTGKCKELVPLRPLLQNKLGGWSITKSDPAEQLSPLWHRKRFPTEPVNGLINLEALGRFLRGNAVSKADIIRPTELVDFDYRTGVGINPYTLAHEEQLIYSAAFISFACKQEGSKKWQAGLYVEVEVPLNEQQSACQLFSEIKLIHLGGEGRRVRCILLEKTITWPEARPSAGENALLVLVTPGMFATGWKPEQLDGLLEAAAVPNPLPLSGWNLAVGGPKITRFAAPAGSTYFLKPGSNDRLNELENPISDHPYDQRDGWGVFVVGKW